jgi:DNA-binding winged helix-turn-helix (wHTH) protein
MVFAFDGFELDEERLQLRRGSKVLKVDAPVLRLLLALVRNAGQLVLKEDLIAEVWEGRAVGDNVITVAMARLRKALHTGHRREEFVNTVYGRGYRFLRPVTRGNLRLDIGSDPPLRPSLPPYVGRERVLARLRQAVVDVGQGRGRVCVLMGEPGIGKTRAVEMLERELGAASTALRVAWAYCQQGQTPPPLFPWQQLWHEIVGPSSQRALPLSTLASVLGLTERFHFTDAPLEGKGEPVPAQAGTTSDAARYRVFSEILQSFTAETANTPWMLVFDDLQGADAASLELLSNLLDRVARYPLLVVATLRATQAGMPERSDPLLARILGHRNSERISVERLTAPDVASYVSALIDDPQGRFGRVVYEKSEGNPFFMTELARQLRDSDEPRPEALAVPDAALDLLRQRVAQVDAGARGLLSVCSVLGRGFDLRVLAEVVRREPEQLIASLDAALRADVLATEPGSQTSFVFTHELIRAALYERITGSERRQHHLRVAEVLSQRLKAGESVHMSELAHHAHAALPLGDLSTTVSFCRAAAEHAVPVFGFRDVARYNRNALEALLLIDRPSPRLRMSLLYLIAIYGRPHDPQGYLQTMDELKRLGREYDNAEMLVRSGSLMNAHQGLKPVGNARPALERGFALLPEDALGLRSLALAGLAVSTPASFIAARCEAYAEQASLLARKADSAGALYVALQAQLHVLGGPLHSERALEIAGQLDTLAQRNPVSAAALPVDLAYYAAARALTLGRLKQARAALERGAAHSRQLHYAELVWHTERALALLQVAAGEREAGCEALEILHARGAQLRLFGIDAFCAYDRVVVLNTAQRDIGGDDTLRGALAYGVEDPPSIWAMKVRALARLGLHDEARSSLRVLEPSAIELLPCNTHHLGTLSLLVHACIALDARRYFAPLTAALRRHPDAFASYPFAICDGPVVYLLALLAEAEGKSNNALWQDALERSERAGFVATVAEARQRVARRGTSKASARAAGDGAKALAANAGETAALATREPTE